MSERHKVLRFLISGAVNTTLTYAAYLGLLGLIGYVPAYTIAYIAGIALSYALNTIFVFRAAPTLRSAMLFPLIYLVQYLLGLAVLYVSVTLAYAMGSALHGGSLSAGNQWEVHATRSTVEATRAPDVAQSTTPLSETVMVPSASTCLAFP